jgi:hypothetical protein
MKPILPFRNRTTIQDGLKINLGQPIVLRTIPAKTITANEIEIKYIVDFYDEKKVVAYTNSMLGEIVLWEGDIYTQIGQWTDDDVTNRIFEILNINQTN